MSARLKHESVSARVLRASLAAAALVIAVLSHPAMPSGAAVSHSTTRTPVGFPEATRPAIERLLTPARLEQGGPGSGGPTISLSTYLGSDLDDGIVALETDSAGNVFVFGTIPDTATFLPWSPWHFTGPQPLAEPNDCFLAKLTPNTAADFLEPEYFALIHDSARCDAMAIAPTGDVYIARTIADSDVIIEQYSNSFAGLQRTNSFDLPHLARVTHLRIDDQANSIVVGECANEAFAGELWPLPNGYQIGPAGISPPCVDTSQAGLPGGQYLMLKAGSQGQVFYGSFFGFDTSQIDPTSVEIDPLGRVYIAGHTNVGAGPTILTTANAFLLQPGDAFCTPNTPECEGGDAFLIVFDTRFQSNESYAYASYLGGSGRESDVAMALAPDGRVHLIGNTQSATSFPGMTFSTTSAIFDLVIDPNQAPVDQLVRSGTIVESQLGASLASHHESGARFRLRPNGTYALLVFSQDPNFPFVEALFDDPRDPNALGGMDARLLVYNPTTDLLVLSTYLDDVTLAHRAHLASAPGGTLYVAMQTTEAGRSTSTTEIGGDDVLAFAIDGIALTANRPPIADAAADQTVAASSPAGTRVLLYGGLSFDPDNDPLTYEWTEGSTSLGSGEFVEVMLTPGVHTITLTVDDGQGGIASDTVTITVVPNTPAGGSITVVPEDSAWLNFGDYNRYPLTITLTDVTATGYTSVTSRSPLPPVPPPGMQFGSPPHVYEVATTSTFTGTITVCADYRGMSFATPASQLQLYQQVNGAWVGVPHTNDVGARRICGTPTTLGTFGVFTPAVASNEISLLAGQPGRSSTCIPPTGPAVQGPDPNEGGLATNSSLCVTRGLAYDAARNYLYFSEATAGDKIRRVDLSTNRITTVAGTGFTTGSLDGPAGDPRDNDGNNVDPLTAPIHEALALALDSAGNLLFTEYGPHGRRIRKVDFALNRLFTVADVSAVSFPSSLAIDSSGAALFAGFADSAAHIWRLSPGADGVLNASPDETLQMIAGTGANFFDPASVPAAGANPLQVGTPTSGLAFGPDGSLYVTVGLGLPSLLRIAPGADGLVDGNGDTLFHVSGVGTLDPILGDGNPVRDSRMFSPWSVAVAQNGDVYVGDGGHFQAATVRRITAGADGVVTGASDEIISTVAGFHVFDPNIPEALQLPYSDGDGHALSSIFGAAWDLEVLPNDDLIITDFLQVRRVGPRHGGTDTTPPVLTLPSNIVAEAQDPGGALVTFATSATDAVDGPVVVNCSTPSGGVFPFAAPGPTTTTVTCSATDTAGNVATGTFTVTVQDTTAPSVTAHPSIVVAATEAAGVRANVPQAPDTSLLQAFLAAGSATDVADQNLQRLPSQRVDCAQPSTILEAITPTTLFTVGQNCVDVAFRDASGNTGHAVAVLDVLPPIGGHVNDPGVVVTATDLNNAPQPVTASFLALQQRGLLRAVPTLPTAGPPAGLIFHGIVYDVTTTALAPAAVSVCLTETRFGALLPDDRLLLFDNGTWVDRTASVDVAASRICGLPTSLGMYAIARMTIVSISVVESIVVTDTPALLPSAMIGVIEQIVVADVPGVVPPVTIDIGEQILVSDTPGMLPSAMIGVNERITVSDQPQVTAEDNVPPVLTLPADIVAEAQSPSGAHVAFTVSATDNLPGVNVACTPASGSLFPFNGSSPTSTTVNCTATDASGNTATGSFIVVVQDTTAPQVVTAQITVAATEPAGARGNVPQAPHTPLLQQIPFLAGATDAGDQNPARVSVQWVACGNHAQVLGAVADTTLYPVGRNCFSYVFRDASGNAGSGIGTIEVSPPIGGHINGPNVPVTATDLSNVPLPVTTTFLALDQPGLLTAEPPQFTPPPPVGFLLVGPPYEIRSTALAPHAVIVCMRPPFGQFAERLLLLEHGQWSDRTNSSDPSTGEVCSLPGPLGTFALARPDLPPLSLTLTPQSATADITHGHVVEARVVDQSNPHSRVTIFTSVPLSIEFRDPLAPNAPLTVLPQVDHTLTLTGLIVSLATNAAGQLTSTAEQVAAAINATPTRNPVSAGTWPGTTGAGIVVPFAPRQLTRLLINHPSIGGPPFYISAPGRVLVHVLHGGGGLHSTESIVAHLDSDDDGVIDSDELVAPAAVTWVDLTPPVLSLPGVITVPATSPAGASVTYVATAFDAINGPIAPACTMPSGATFPVGTTTVTCTATDASGNQASGGFIVTVLPFVAPAVLTTLTPETAAAGSGSLAITITGSGFDSGATALWNGSARPTVVNSTTQLTMSILAADLATVDDLTTVQITVSNGSGVSNPLPFLIVSASVVSVDAEIVMPGDTATASNAPEQFGQHGVTATLINDDGASPPATVAVASYGTNPVGDAVFAAGGFFDVQVTGADPSDSLTAQFYYPSTVVGLAEIRLRLLYWNGAGWQSVVGSGGAVPVKDTTDDLDGTISGGRFAVTLDSTSIPAITDLGGTVFALVEEEDRVAPITTLTQSPASNAHGWNNTDVALTLAATDNLSGVARIEFIVNGGEWQTYEGPIVLRHSGVYALKYRSVDTDGNVEPTKTATVKIDTTDPVALVVALPPLLLPANRRMVDVSVLQVAADLFSGVDRLILVSVTSDDPGMTADDVTGWTIGTNDTSGKLRAERTASGGRRIYRLTYRVSDRAGNESLATALVIVP